MTNNNTIKAETDRGLFVFVLIGGGIGSCLLAYHLINTSFKEYYPDLTSLCIGSVFGIVGLFSFKSVLALDDLEVFTDKIVIKSILGFKKQTIYISDIITWTEIKKENKHIIWSDLTIYTSKSKYVILSSIYSNYPTIKKAITKGIKRDLERQDNWHVNNSKQLGLIYIVVSLFFLFLSFNSYKNLTEIKQIELTTLKQKIVSKIEILTGSKGSKSLKLKLQQYPDFDFQVIGPAFSVALVDKFITDVKTGDTLLVDIKRDEYRMKLSKEDKLGFLDKIIDYKFISVYGLRDKKNNYLSLSNYNEHKKSEAPWVCLFFGLAGLGMLVVAIFQFIKYEKKPNA